MDIVIYRGYRDMSCISWLSRYIVNIVIYRVYREYRDVSCNYIVDFMIYREYHDIS